MRACSVRDIYPIIKVRKVKARHERQAKGRIKHERHERHDGERRGKYLFIHFKKFTQYTRGIYQAIIRIDSEHYQPLFPVQFYSQFPKHVKQIIYSLDSARYQTIKRVIHTIVSRGDLMPFERVFHTSVSRDVPSDASERFKRALDA